MKRLKKCMALLLLGGAIAGNAWADHGYHGHYGGYYHGHANVGIVIGAPLFGPWYYPPYYYPYYSPYYYPPAVIENTAPPTYIEQPAKQAPQTAYWYYCRAAKAYYPYIKECPEGWQRVLPQPAPAP